jgi:mRNA-degrading endonuclease toxin of MazEF toxin-antitoxin module
MNPDANADRLSCSRLMSEMHSNDLLVAPLSSVLRDAPTHVRLRRGEGGITASSVVKCEQITTLQKARVMPSALGGPLSAGRMLEIERAVLRAIGVMVPLPD